MNNIITKLLLFLTCLLAFASAQVPTKTIIVAPTSIHLAASAIWPAMMPATAAETGIVFFSSEQRPSTVTAGYYAAAARTATPAVTLKLENEKTARLMRQSGPIPHLETAGVSFQDPGFVALSAAFGIMSLGMLMVA